MSAVSTRRSGCGKSELVSRYLDGELTPGRCQLIERHLRACPACAATAQRLRRMIAACHDAQDTGLPSAVRARARSRIKALMRQPKPRGRA
jgi:anti-sigma factor RsiW